MGSRIEFELPTGEPTGLIASPITRPDGFPTAELRRLEYSCRGDRVPCTLLTPAANGSRDARHPLVLLQAEGRNQTSAPLPERTRDWIEAGCAVASIDLPLQGVRRSTKQSELLAESIQIAARGGVLERATKLLWCEFTRQSVLELRRTLDVLTEIPSVDPERVGFAGFGIGAFTGAILCAVDPRPCAAVLAATGGGFAPPEIDPARYVGAIAPRPLLLINDKLDEQRGSGASGITVPATAAKLLHDAANEPKRIEWRADAAEAHDAAWLFLSPLLGL
jgi:dienelactone hydrolase